MNRAIVALFALCLMIWVVPARAVESPAHLRCEFRENPLGIESRPRLGWWIPSPERGRSQIAYQILAASSRERLDADSGDLWDSGKVASTESTLIPYQGAPLLPFQQAWWKCRVWRAGDDQPTPWSEPAAWTRGPEPGRNWAKTEWIEFKTQSNSSTPSTGSTSSIPPLPIFRKSFSLEKPVRRAVVCVCGLGHGELLINGRRIGERQLDPGWTNYRKTCLYTMDDVTGELREGENAIGVMLGNGMYNVTGGRYKKFLGSFGPPKLILQLHIEFADGTTRDIGTDATWKAAAGPIRFSCIYGGEDYDARAAQPGWDRPGFDDTGWATAAITKSPGGILRAQMQPPTRIQTEFASVKITEPRPGVFVHDLGRNFSGWPRLRVKGPAGARVKLTTGELLDANGLVTQRSSGGPTYFSYTLAGSGEEDWHPRFSYTGFRYVQVESSGTAPSGSGTVPSGMPARGLSPKSGTVPSSSGTVPSGMPARGLSPKSGTVPSGSGTVPSGMPARGLSPKSGTVPSSSGTVPSGMSARGLSPTPPMLPQVLSVSGQFLTSAVRVGEFECSNPRINAIHRLICAAIESNLQSVLTDCPHREKLGWLEVSHLLGRSIMFNYDVPNLYAKICMDIHEAQLENGLVPDIAPEYTVFSGGFRDSPEWGSAVVIDPWLVYQMYGDRFPIELCFSDMMMYEAYGGTKAGSGNASPGLGDWYDIGPKPPGVSQLTSPGVTAAAIAYQRADIMAQISDMVLKSGRESRRVAAEIRDYFNRTYFHPDTDSYDRDSQTANAMAVALGITQNRRAAVADRLVANIRANGNRVTAGDVGFHYVVEALAGTGHDDVIYDMVTQDAGPGYVYQLNKGATTLTEAWDTNPASSQNHCMLGHVEEWFFTGIGGIQQAAPGFKKIRIKPALVGDLAWAKASYDSVRGRIACSWRRENGRLALDIEIPSGAEAEVWVPTSRPESVTESGQKAAAVQGVKFERTEPGAAVFRVECGKYSFAADL